MSVDNLRPSMTEVGDGFRNSIAGLLRTKYEKVDVEKIISGKAVDIYVEYYDFGSVVRVGFECKRYKKSLTSDYIRKEIISHYSSLISDRHLNFVVIVANKPLGPNARATVEGAYGFRFRTTEQLQEDVIGIRPYINSLVDVFDHDPQGLPQHYVPGRFKEDPRAATDVLDEWLNDPTQRSIAILGGYGTGKTSLSKYYASYRAKKFLSDATERMPILIGIGSEVYETKLESVFGKLFSSRLHGNNFRFDAMMRLNEEGRLVFIFDGFDEMKHAMTSADFRANFSEINRLILSNEKAKVILLGRPSALTSEDRVLVFRGKSKVGDDFIANPDWPEWREAEIDRLDSGEVRTVLWRILKTHMPEVADTDLSEKVQHIVNSVSHELLSRPIHARLVATIATDPRIHFQGFRLFHVYYHFMKELLLRDSGRYSRRLVSVDDRREFQERLAFWSWRQKERYFHRDAIPDALFEGLVVADAIDKVARNSEFIVTALVEEKELGVMYFGHRSIQEYLVSRYFHKTMKVGVEQVYFRVPEFLSSFGMLSAEILMFVREAKDIGFFKSLWIEVASFKSDPQDYPFLVMAFLKETKFFVDNFVKLIYGNASIERDRIDPQFNLDILAHVAESAPEQGDLLEREALRTILLGGGDADDFLTAVGIAVSIGLRHESLNDLAAVIALRASRLTTADAAGDSVALEISAKEAGILKRVTVRDGILCLSDIRAMVVELYGSTVAATGAHRQERLSGYYYRAIDGDMVDRIEIEQSVFRFAAHLNLDALNDEVRDIKAVGRSWRN